MIGVELISQHSRILSLMLHVLARGMLQQSAISVALS